MEKFKVLIILDAAVLPNGRSRISVELTHDELLKLGRDFKKWILVHVWRYLLNKRHIVAIDCDWRDKESVWRYLDSVMILEENPFLFNDK